MLQLFYHERSLGSVQNPLVPAFLGVALSWLFAFLSAFAIVKIDRGLISMLLFTAEGALAGREFSKMAFIRFFSLGVSWLFVSFE